MSHDTTRLDTDRTTHSGPSDRILGDHPTEAAADAIVTPDGDIAVDGGKLAGHKDNFNGEFGDERTRRVPGADGAGEDGSGQVSPPGPAKRPGQSPVSSGQNP